MGWCEVGSCLSSLLAGLRVWAGLVASRGKCKIRIDMIMPRFCRVKNFQEIAFFLMSNTFRRVMKVNVVVKNVRCNQSHKGGNSKRACAILCGVPLHTCPDSKRNTPEVNDVSRLGLASVKVHWSGQTVLSCSTFRFGPTKRRQWWKRLLAVRNLCSQAMGEVRNR